jgi:hypothetical protein
MVIVSVWESQEAILLTFLFNRKPHRLEDVWQNRISSRKVVASTRIRTWAIRKTWKVDRFANKPRVEITHGPYKSVYIAIDHSSIEVLCPTTYFFSQIMPKPNFDSPHTFWLYSPHKSFTAFPTDRKGLIKSHGRLAGYLSICAHLSVYQLTWYVKQQASQFGLVSTGEWWWIISNVKQRRSMVIWFASSATCLQSIYLFQWWFPIKAEKALIIWSNNIIMFHKLIYLLLFRLRGFIFLYLFFTH